jgi:hypothetical protein
MATVTEKKPNKTSFVTEFLRKNPTANALAVNEAWTRAGQTGTISTTLVQNVRKGEGLTGNVRPGTRAGKGNGATKAPKAKTKKRGRKKIARKGNGRRRSPDNGSQIAPSLEKKSRSNDRMLEEVEGDIDRLIFKLMDIGRMEEVEDALRRVRRMLYRG